jgi:nitroreductase
MAFDNSRNWCIDCGHCIAVCPEDAIEYETGKDTSYTFDNVSNLSSEISYEQFYNFVRAKRSIRHYKSDKVPQEMLDKVFDVIRYSPSSSNGRIWRFRVISDSEVIEKLSKRIQTEILNHPILKLRYGEKLPARIEAGRTDPLFFDAPHIVLISSPMDLDIAGNDAGIAFTYGMLAAETLGLGTCWIGLAQLPIEAIKEVKKMAKVIGKCWGVMTIGYPQLKYYRCPPRDPIKVKWKMKKKK